MAEAARTMDPDELKRVGLHLHAYLNPDGEFDDVDRAQKRDLKVSKQGADHMAGITGTSGSGHQSVVGHRRREMGRAGHEQPERSGLTHRQRRQSGRETLEAAAERDTRTPGSAIMMRSNG